jgi:hypothetical protein
MSNKSHYLFFSSLIEAFKRFIKSNKNKLKSFRLCLDFKEQSL